MSDRSLTPLTRPFDLALAPPGSKSLTNRALVLAALADGRSCLRNILHADDTAVMIAALRQLGFALEVDEACGTVEVTGCGGGVPSDAADLFCGNSGTTIRFLSALCSLGKGSYALDGVQRMRQRPIAELGTMLGHLGVRMEYPQNEGFPPIRILAHGLPGGRLHFGAAQSSQYLSAVLQVAPYARHEVRIDLGWPQTSWPYVQMTMRLMDVFGLTPELIRDPVTQRPTRIIVPTGHYRAVDYAVEPDASNASYFLAAAAINKDSKITIHNLGNDSLQGDVALAELLHQMGAEVVFGRDFITVVGSGRLNGIDVSMADMPDMAQTLAVVVLFADAPTTLRDLHTLRVKETDRVAALATELAKLGAVVELDGDAMTIRPPDKVAAATIDTYDDHRMAMSFAVVGTRVGGIVIRDAECVNKTYPRFFDDFGRLA